MNDNIKQIPTEQPDDLRIRLTQLKKSAYPLVVLFYIIKEVIDAIGVAANLDDVDVDSIIFDTMIEKITQMEQGV